MLLFNKVYITVFFMHPVLTLSFEGGPLDFGKVGVWLAPNNFRFNSISDLRILFWPFIKLVVFMTK